MTAMPEKKKRAQRSDQKNISRSAFKVGAGSLFGLAAGMISQMLIAYLFGTGREMDAFLTAMTIPAYLQGVLLATLSFVFIPAFVESISDGREEEAWALVGTFFWLLGVVLSVIAIVIALFATQLIGFMAPELSPEKTELAANMLSIMIFSFPIAGFTIFSAGIQNAQNKFFWPAVRGAANSLANVVVLALVYQYTGSLALAWGYLAAEIAETALTTIPVLRHGWKRTLPLNDKRVLNILWLVAPLIGIGILTRITPIFERYFASGLPDGDLSYLGYANKAARLFQGLFGATIATAIFPVMAKAYAKAGVSGLVENFKYGVRLTTAIGLPLVAIGVVIATPLTTFLFERGAFDANSTWQVARVLPIVLIKAGFLYMMGNLMTRAFYVTKDTRTVPIISLITVVLYIGLAAFLVQRWGYIGLASAETIHNALGTTILAALLVYKYQLYNVGNIFKHLVRYGLPTLVAMGVTWLVLSRVTTNAALVQLIIAGAVFVPLYIILLFLTDREIAVAVLEVTGVEKLNKFRPVQQLLQRLKLTARPSIEKS